MEKSVKFLPLIGSVIVFFGYLKLQFFYTYFDIDIIYYLEFSEIITLFLNDITTIILSLVLLLIYALAIVPTFDNIFRFFKWVIPALVKKLGRFMGGENVPTNENVYESPNENIKTTIPTNDDSSDLAFIGAIVSGVIVLIMSVYYHSWNYSGVNFLRILNIYGSLTIIVIFTEIVFKRTIERRKKSDKVFNSVGLISLVGILFFLVFNLAKSNHYKVLNNPKNVILELTDGTKLCTNDDFKFIGKTRGFYFFSDIETKDNLIIPISQVINYKEVKNIDCRCNCTDF
jgi:hypothetical protein